MITPIMVTMNHKPLSLSEAKAMAVPLKIRKGMKNKSRLFKQILIVSAPRMNEIGKKW